MWSGHNAERTVSSKANPIQHAAVRLHQVDRNGKVASLFYFK